MLGSKVITVSIECSLEKAYAFLSAPANFPQWASGLCTAIEKKNEEWIAKTQMGNVKVMFTPSNDLGVLDHAIVVGPKKIVYVPMRVVKNEAGCDVMVTLFHQEGMSPARFAEDIGWVERDLDALKDLLEERTHHAKTNH